jgi:magnesium-transporting ATPase (P-type)
MVNKFIKKQSWFKVLCFQIITFGIYGIFWIKNIREDAKSKGKENEINNSLINLFSVFVFIKFISTVIFYYFSFNTFFNTGLVINKTIYQFITLLLSLGNFAVILLIVLAFQCRKYLEETYGIKSNAFLTLIFTIIQLQYRINEEYNKIENNSQSINNNVSVNEISQNELMAKEYIENYKSQYSREQIKSALLNNGISEVEVENYLNKYF